MQKWISCSSLSTKIKADFSIRRELIILVKLWIAGMCSERQSIKEIFPGGVEWIKM